MLVNTNLEVGQLATMKKTHPCGSNTWEIIRVGMDIGMKCCGCGHFIMLPRSKFLKAVKNISTK